MGRLEEIALLTVPDVDLDATTVQLLGKGPGRGRRRSAAGPLTRRPLPAGSPGRPPV
jgi:hypothetical protein